MPYAPPSDMPPRGRIFTTVLDDDTDEDYDVYLFYPSQNRGSLRHRLPCEVGVGDDTADDLSDWTRDSIDSLPALEHSVRKLPSPPSEPRIPELVFPVHVDDSHIEKLGYSKMFRTGFWAQSRRITRRLDAFVASAIGKLRSLKRRLTRRTS